MAQATDERTGALGLQARALLNTTLVTLQQDPEYLDITVDAWIKPFGKPTYTATLSTRITYKALIAHSEEAHIHLIAYRVDTSKVIQYGLFEDVTSQCIMINVDQLINEWFGDKRDSTYKADALAHIIELTRSLSR